MSSCYQRRDGVIKKWGQNDSYFKPTSLTHKQGENEEITLAGTKTGTFDLVCRFHHSSGMKGSLTVQ